MNLAVPVFSEMNQPIVQLVVRILTSLQRSNHPKLPSQLKNHNLLAMVHCRQFTMNNNFSPMKFIVVIVVYILFVVGLVYLLFH